MAKHGGTHRAGPGRHEMHRNPERFMVDKEHGGHGTHQRNGKFLGKSRKMKSGGKRR